MGEGWGEGEPPFVLSLSKRPLVIARSVSDVALPPQITLQSCPSCSSMLDSAPTPLMGEGWGEGEPPFVLSLSKRPLVIAHSVSDVALPPQITLQSCPSCSSMLDSASSPLMGEGWGEGEPPFVLSLSKRPLVIARNVSDVALPRNCLNLSRFRGNPIAPSFTRPA